MLFNIDHISTGAETETREVWSCWSLQRGRRSIGSSPRANVIVSILCDSHALIDVSLISWEVVCNCLPDMQLARLNKIVSTLAFFLTRTHAVQISLFFS